MSIRFEVKSTQVAEKRGVAKATGKPYVIREQSAYVPVEGKPYPVEVKINLNDLAPLDVGWFEVGQECVYVKRFGEVGVDLSRARKLPASAVKAA